ncbi:MAG: hypothetical protein EZS28_030408 [Streblomastix strix]|uniref:Uncharacterized protein n=1 Tax=Streblomastix strix TaxID=222440 RepID=A0A5J4UTX0_9EUKA|nr:MAG: hypothetical protein EZS28_030408 [Streblomastix strix]
MHTTKKGKKAKKSQKAIATRPILPLIRKSIKEKENQQYDPESDYEYAKHMQEKKFRQVNYQRLRTEQLAKILELMRQKGLKLKKGITQAEQQIIEDEIRRMDTSITAAEAHGGVLAISNPAARRRIYTEGFHKCLLQELYETNIRINNEGKLIGEKYMENIQRYDQNINSGLAQAFTNLRSNQLVITPEQQLNELMNEVSPKQKQFLNRQLDSEFANQKYTLAQEKLSETQQQQKEADIISSMNLNTVHDIGALDWGRSPINDIYGRKPFETYDTGYKYDQFGNPIAFMMKPTQPIAKIAKKK